MVYSICVEQTRFLRLLTSNVRLKAAKKIARSKYRILHALHKLHKKKTRKTSVVQANTKVAFHTITSSISLVTSY